MENGALTGLTISKIYSIICERRKMAIWDQLLALHILDLHIWLNFGVGNHLFDRRLNVVSE